MKQFCFNFTQACAAGMIYLTVHIFDYVGPVKHVFDVYYLTGPAGVLIGLSILLIAVGFIGCCAACKDSRCLHITVSWSLTKLIHKSVTQLSPYQIIHGWGLG